MQEDYPNLALVSSQKLDKEVESIGPWCYLNEFNKGDFSGLEKNFFNLNGTNQSKQDLSNKALEYQKRFIHYLAKVLNKHHGKSYSEKYWSILLSTSVISVIESVINKIQAVENNNNYYQSNIYNLTSHPVLSSTRSLINWLNTDEGVLYIFSNILSKSNQNKIYVNKRYDFIQQKKSRSSQYKSIKRTVLEYFRIYFSFLFSLKNGVYLDSIKGLSYKDLFLLKIYHKKIRKNLIINNKKNKPIQVTRETMFSEFYSNNLDEEIIQNILKHLLPTIFFEKFNLCEKICFLPSYLICRYNNKLVCGAVLGGNDVAKFTLAKCVHNQSELIISQHGSNYGTSLVFTTMTASEYFNCERFISWGWSTHSGYQMKVDSLASPYLSKLNNNDKVELTNEIVYVGNNISIYGDRIASGPDTNQLGKYFMDKVKFIDFLVEDLAEILKYKPYPLGANGLIDESSFIKSKVEKIIISEKYTNFLTSSKMLVADHPGTIMLERFVVNKPIVIFIDEKIWLFSKQSQKFIDLLHKVNVIHYGPMSAAQFVNNNYENCEEWWYSSAVQEAVSIFVSFYAKHSKNFISEWQDYLSN